MKALIEAVRRKSGLVEGDIPQRFSVASFWLLLGTLMWRVPSALSTILIARLLGPVGFGQFGIISSTV
ncbi:MAG: hypothetical protein MUF80_09235, partial [Burkholderiales bacterium]|nr:hypothetical protein [Burkholderiales bacterium]